MNSFSIFKILDSETDYLLILRIIHALLDMMIILS